MSYSGRYTNKTPKRKKRKSNTLWIVLGTVLGLILVVGVAAVMYVNSMLGLVRRPVEEDKEPDPSLIAGLIGNLDEEEDPGLSGAEATEKPKPDYSRTGKIINIMVVGQDSRAGEEAKLSDTMLLLTINRETNTMTMTSFLRDMYIKLPDMWGHRCGKNRINTAYALGFAWKGETGSMQMLDQLILEQFGTTVDYNVEIDFTAFETIINKLDGVDVVLDEDEAKYLNAQNCFSVVFQAGENHLDGLAALYYARMRHATPGDNDMNRTARQRKVVSAVLEKCKSMSLTDLHNLLTEVIPMVLTDMPNDVILTYAADLLPDIGSLKMESLQIPAEGTYGGKVIDILGVSSGVLIPDVEANRKLLMAVAEADRVEEP